MTPMESRKHLAAAKKAVKANHAPTFARRRMEDGKDCFEISKGGRAIERHIVG